MTDKSQKRQTTLSDLFDEMQNIIDKFENEYEQTLKKIKDRLEVEKQWQEQKKADGKQPSQSK